MRVAAVALCCLIVPSVATSHDLPEGTVKIANQVVVSRSFTSIRYDVGFNPETLKSLVSTMDEDRVSDDYDKNLAAFRELFAGQIKESIKVEMNGEVVEDVEVKVEPEEIAKHVQARFELVYENNSIGNIELVVTDSSFLNQTRIYGSGFKSEGKLAVVESSTKAIPIRSKPMEKAPDEPTPFVISGAVKSLEASYSGSGGSSSLAPLIVLAFALGGAGFVGFLMVPNDLSSDHDDHH